MDQFRADLHIHSRYSRATSKALTPRNLAAWASVKGLDVMGTGDCTHPGWIEELEEALVEDGEGLYRLSSDDGLSREIPWLEGYLPNRKARFILQGEVSSIYKRGGKVRKVHNLIFMPNFEAAKKLNTRLDAIGNITSDGRPILGLDSRDLLEMVLETDPLAFLVPAHIWTPWFSLFGSKSGFDHIEECFGDLSSEIFALETGLSSDPEMNWHLSMLDRFRLISNSDAHSGEKLGRESNLFSGTMSYETIYRALRGEGLGQKFLGTVEFFPEEGKYHMDGHRKCEVIMDPQETASRGGICPVCGKPVTVGVYNRVLELADRTEAVKPTGQPGFVSLIPLDEIMGEVLGVGPKTKKVRALYTRALSRFGSETTILMDAPAEELRKVNPLLAEAVMRMRAGKVIRNPGFDGQFGVISVFTEKERAEMKQGKFLVNLPNHLVKPKSSPEHDKHDSPPAPSQEKPVIRLNDAQQEAVTAGPGAVLVLAGPGTGKTQTLMGRIEHLLQNDVPARHILAVTFTRRAAAEMENRLRKGDRDERAMPRADTLHALGHDYWMNISGTTPILLGEDSAFRLFKQVSHELSGTKLRQAWQMLNLSREQMVSLEAMAELEAAQGLENESPSLATLAIRYREQKEAWNLVDYTDLLEFWLEHIRLGSYTSPYTHVLVDEVQDLSPLQLEICTSLCTKGGKGFFAIGDPRQSIYSFRGAHGNVTEYLKNIWPELQTITLVQNYRSAAGILQVSQSLYPNDTALQPNVETEADIQLFNAPDQAREASWIGERIRKLLGSTSSTLAQDQEEALLSPGDIAILVRMKSLAANIEKSLTRLGIPCSVPQTEAFWQDPRITSILQAAESVLGMGEATDEDEDALDIPERVIVKGPTSIAAYLEDIPPFDRLFWQSKAFRELQKKWKEFGGWAALLNWINLQSDLEQVSNRAEKVQIMSMHAAKGLEFDAVFVAGLEDGLMPFAGKDFLAGKLDGDQQANIDEERRLLYVSMTRARRQLYLSYCDQREMFGRKLQLKPSRFMQVLPQELLNPSTLVARTVKQEKPLQLM